MIINEAMVTTLHAIQRSESSFSDKKINVPETQLGNSLIALYYETHRLSTRKMITEFMTQAGIVWLRKLLTKDTGPIASSRTQLASMSDYLGLLSVNNVGSEIYFVDVDQIS